MSQPTQIDIQLFAPAYADEPPPIEVVTDLMGTTAGTTTIAAQPNLPTRQITVGVIPVWGVAIGWVLAVMLASQAAKRVMKAIGVKDRLSAHVWRRWLYVVPIVLGTVLSVLFGSALGELFGLRFGLWTALVFLGPGSGATAAFVYDALRSIVLPILPATLIGLIERVTKITLPAKVKDAVKFRADTQDSEAFAEDSEPSA